MTTSEIAEIVYKVAMAFFVISTVYRQNQLEKRITECEEFSLKSTKVTLKVLASTNNDVIKLMTKEKNDEDVRT